MTETPVTVDEKYTNATNASNLRVEADRGSQADVLIAAAWSPSRLGGALLRLHSEFDGAQHPRRLRSDAVKAMALSMSTPKDGSGDQKARHQYQEAVKLADHWYRDEVALMLARLKSLPDVRRQLTMQAAKWGVFQPQDVVAAVLIWWLDRQCQQCHGVKFQVIEGTPSLSHKLCPCCRGTGEAYLPHASEGRRLANHIESCIGAARQNIKQRLRRGDAA